MPSRSLTSKAGEPRKQTAYEYGRQAEYNARDSLKSIGYHVIRAAASQGIFDLVAWHLTGRDVLGVQIKRGDKPSPCEYKTAIELPVPPGTLKLVVWYPHGLSAARVLYCADHTGPVAVPDWCLSIRWLEGLPPKQTVMRLS